MVALAERAAEQSARRLQLNFLAVTLSGALINNVLTLGRKRPDLTFRNSWEVRRRREELGGSQLTVTLAAWTQQATGGALGSRHQRRLQTFSFRNILVLLNRFVVTH